VTDRFSASRGKRRPSPWRWRCTNAACSPGAWAAALAAEIKRAQAAGDPDTGETYYAHWLATLEKLVAEKGVTTHDTLHRYRDAWDHACDRTPHGQPITLLASDFR
jgi:nitrile hydratase accessory protein